MKKRHMLLIPLVAVGALFSCNPDKSDGYTLDSVEVVLDTTLSTVKVGNKVDSKVIKQVNATYVKKDDSGEVIETKKEEDVKGYTVKTDFSKILDYNNINDGFSVDVEYKSTKGSKSITVVDVFEESTVSVKTGPSSSTKSIKSDLITSSFATDELYYELYPITPKTENSITYDNVDTITIAAEATVGHKADLIAYNSSEKTTILSGCTIEVIKAE